MRGDGRTLTPLSSWGPPFPCRPAADREQDPQEARNQRPAQAARTLRGEVEGDAQAEEAEERADGAQVGGAGRQHLGIVAEEVQPRLRPDCSGKAHRLRQREG